jgi:hypothetical protein
VSGDCRQQLTAKMHRRSVMTEAMKNREFPRKKSVQAAVLALATVIALLIAPVCGPLCAATACRESRQISGAYSSCHHSEAITRDGLHLRGKLEKPCNLAELPAATLNSTKSNLELEGTRSAASETRFVAEIPPMPSAALRIVAQRSMKHTSKTEKTISLATSVLNI